MTFLPAARHAVDAPPVQHGAAPVLAAEDLHRSFGLRRVLRGIDLVVSPGERVVLFGPNGAGKTTLLRMLALLLRPDRGVIRVAGLDSRRAAADVRRLVGFASHQPSIYADLTAIENLRFFARLYGLEQPEEHIGELLARFGLYARRNARVRTYSRGMQQRLALLRAVLHDPVLLLLDEPDTGLDPAGLDALTLTVAEAAGAGRGMIISTHEIRRGLALADRVLVLLNGRIRLDERTAAYTEASFRRQYAALLEDAEWRSRR